MGHKPMIEAAKTTNGYEYEHWFKYIKNRIEKYDLSVLNLEVTLAGEPYSGYPMFREMVLRLEPFAQLTQSQEN
jgi:poly-gamma-glutamate synthesis protein (capsule biosynthesis protein)